MEDRAQSNSGEKPGEIHPGYHCGQEMSVTLRPGLAKPTTASAEEISGIKPARNRPEDSSPARLPRLRPIMAPAKKQPDEKWRILFIDDEAMVARMGDRTLTKLGYEVVVTTTAKEAIELFNSDPDHFDLVITDQTMPSMTGAVLSKKLLETRPNLPIILTTGYSEKSVQEQTQDLDIRAFVRKPIEIRSLSEIIHNILVEGETTQQAVSAGR